MILGIGVDITTTDRFLNTNSYMNKLANRILTDNELSEYSILTDNKDTFLAKKWASKEAVAKAFKTGMAGDTKWKNIEIRHNAQGAPYVCFYNELKETAEILNLRCHITISDNLGTVIAYTILESMVN